MRYCQLGMTYPPESHASRRSPRVSFPEATPAVVRVESGLRVSGKLDVISLNGGLLSLPKPLNEGSLVKVMFVTEAGPVLGEGEMLRPVHRGAQAFKFTMLLHDDQRRLKAAILMAQDRTRRDYQRLEASRVWS